MLASVAIAAVGVTILTPGAQAVRTLVGRATHVVIVDVEPRQFISLALDQGETDLKAVVSAPGKQPIASYDEWERGTEWISFLADTGGRYRLEVGTVSPPAARVEFRVRFESARLYTESDSRWIEVEQLTTRARHLIGKGDKTSFREALALRTKALALWQSLEVPAAVLATSVGIGDALYRLTQYDDAEAAYRRALSLSQAWHDQRTEAEILNNLAATMSATDRFNEALALFEQALPLWRTLGFTRGEATTLTNQGVLLWRAGEFDEARRHHVNALAMFRSRGSPPNEAYTLNNLAMALDTIGDRRHALDYLARARAVLHAAKDKLAEGRVLVRRGQIQLALGNQRAALASVQEALRLIASSSDRLAEADALEQLGRVYDASGNTAGARAEYDRALALYRTVGSRRGESDARHDSGLTHLASRDYEEAIAAFTQALELRRAIGVRSLEAETRFSLARAERLNGNLAAARSHADAAVTIAEGLRAGVFERELRTSYSSSIHKYYAEQVDVLAALHRQRPGAGFDALAFEAVERARARGLVESLREIWTGVSGSGDAALLKRERQLREELDYWSWKVWDQADLPAADERNRIAHAKVETLIQDHAAAVADLQRANPRSAELLQPPPLPLSTIQRELLDDRTVLLEYALGDERSYLWAVTPKEVQLIELPRRAEIERHVRAYYARIAADPQDAARPADSRDGEAAALGRLLLAPVEKLIGSRRVMAVADGALNNIPFAALRVSGRSGPLVESHDLVMLPSSTMLALLRRELATRTPAPKALAMFADPVFDVADARVPRAPAAARVASDTPRSRRLSRLPYSRDEAEGILEMVPADMALKALDFDATRALVMSPAMSAYRLLHLGGHGIRDDVHPELSGIVLSLVDRQGKKQDGFLRLQDLYNLHLQADLVVLSACETAIGRLVGGEGLSSMARGFFYAGAARVLATLWKVDDEATAAIMQLFYKALLVDGASPASALRTAQQAMRRQSRWEDPYYWSGFVLQGEW